LTASLPAFSGPAGVLENVKTIEVDPTVIEQPASIKDSLAANLVRYDLRAAVRDALLQEGNSPLRVHFVLDEFSSPGAAVRLMNLDSGRTVRNVKGRLVFQDSSGKELANIAIHFRGSVALNPGAGNNAQGRRAASHFEKRLLDEIERLK
jgi:hypothetical protein